MRLINIGYGNMAAAERIISVVTPDSVPVKRLCQTAKEKERLVDATLGRRTRSVIIMDSGHIVLSAILPETIGNRLGGAGVTGNE
ncbi:MAG: DUF370 domain-containing protein [Oscillospiraceae bacterium]|jgi:regulator of extracellular matrix RemA (YlzA/DUF370 family)|nr:DUF370 domain-containing protein [Oscillospiraceae bacterium]